MPFIQGIALPDENLQGGHQTGDLLLTDLESPGPAFVGIGVAIVEFYLFLIFINGH